MATAIALAAPANPPLNLRYIARGILRFFWLSRDEVSYRALLVSRDVWRIRVSVVTIAALTVILTLDHDRNEYAQSHVLLSVFFLCRAAPVLLLLLCSFLASRQWLARYWSPLGSALTLFIALSVFLLHYLRSHDSGYRSSGLAAAELVPWVPLSWIAMHPLVLACGLCAAWYDVLWSGGASVALLGGLVLTTGAKDALATAAAVSVASLIIALTFSYALDAERRESFRREAALSQETHDMAERFAERSIGQEMYQKLADGIKRSGIMVSEIDEGGIVSWVSPGCYSLLGVTPRDMIRLETFRWVHPSDVGFLRVSWDCRLGE
jgi:PAS domain-containing protein